VYKNSNSTSKFGCLYVISRVKIPRLSATATSLHAVSRTALHHLATAPHASALLATLHHAPGSRYARHRRSSMSSVKSFSQLVRVLVTAQLHRIHRKPHQHATPGICYKNNAKVLVNENFQYLNFNILPLLVAELTLHVLQKLRRDLVGHTTRYYMKE